MATTFSDVHPSIIQTHILPRLDGLSLSSTAAASSYFQHLCTDENLWSHICKSTWPSIADDPRLHDIISTFSAGHRSFFQDSFPALVTDVNHHNHLHDLNCSSHRWSSQLISAVDIRYQNDTIYSKVEFTDTTDEFMSSVLRIKLNHDIESKHAHGILRSINVNVDEFAGADEATVSHLEESLSLNWIIIDPTQKRAGNISSIKPIGVRQGWMTNQTYLVYAIVLPGCDPNKMVQCRIQVVLAVAAGGVGLHVKEVMLELMDLDFCRLKGRDFLVIIQGALSEENNVRRKMVDAEESRRLYQVFKRISINSHSDMQSTKIQSNVHELHSNIGTLCRCLLQRLFHLMKVRIQCIVIRLKVFEFVSCVIFVVILLWLIDLFPVD
ncbi:F-box protein At2g27310-like [Lactuca sativa]|uniref:F-box protein At2g27310-like n=1 Tax=Lactuca sativa TaxID=4236 RepID=UPI000CBF9AFF|nr:F-box protein At2g27310-like [Lactuca sativa]